MNSEATIPHPGLLLTLVAVFIVSWAILLYIDSLGDPTWPPESQAEAPPGKSRT